MFLGPMPIYTLPPVSRIREEEEAAEFVSQHGLRIFLQQGGHVEEWTEAKAHEYKERLKQNILESVAWHALSKSISKGKFKKGMMPTVEWRGDSFEIGKVFGVEVNLMLASLSQEDGQRSQFSGDTASMARRTKSAATVHWDEPHGNTLLDVQSSSPNIAASLTKASSASRPSHLPAHRSAPTVPVAGASDGTKNNAGESDGSPSSQTPLYHDALSTLGSPTRHQHAPTVSTGVKDAIADAASPSATHDKGRLNLKSILQRPGVNKGKGKAVRYATTPRIAGSPTGNRSPAPPEEVLNRSGAEVEDSSAAAAAAATDHSSTSSDFGGDEDGPYVSRGGFVRVVSVCKLRFADIL